MFEVFLEVEIALRGCCLGVEIGLESIGVRWKAALRKYKAHLRHVDAMPLNVAGGWWHAVCKR